MSVELDQFAMDRWKHHNDLKQKRFNDTVPAVFREATIVDLSEGQYDAARNWAMNPLSWCLYLQGKQGRGKSHMAFAIVHRWIAAGLGDGAWVYVPDALDTIRKEAMGERSNRPDLVEKLQYFDGILLLDNMDGERQTEFSIQETFRIIYARESERRKTIITSNLKIEEIGKALSNWIMSRIAGGEVVEIRGPDLRVQKGLA